LDIKFDETEKTTKEKLCYTAYMKQLVFLIFPFILTAQTYIFSGGVDNVVQIIASKVLERAYEKAGLDMEAKFTTLEESLRLSSTGITDGELARIKKITKLYPQLIRVPVTLVSVEAVAYTKNTQINIQTWDDLAKYDFTIVKGAKFIEKETSHLQKNFVSTFEKAFEALEKGKTEIIVVPKKAAVRIILKKEYHNIHAAGPVLKKVDLYHFVHKRNAHLIPILTPILKQMERNKEILYLRQAYLRTVINQY